jgi:hypothetical protein
MISKPADQRKLLLARSEIAAKETKSGASVDAD